MSCNYRIMSHERETKPPASSAPAVVNFIVSDIPMVIVFNNLSIFFNRQHEVTSLLSFGEWTIYEQFFPRCHDSNKNSVKQRDCFGHQCTLAVVTQSN